MSLSPVLLTTVLIGVSKVAQMDDIRGALAQPALPSSELARIEAILAAN